ncbi:radical SAM protein, partial [candidate division KSB1 bacterium]|nr:radical SAM protein [candidate division KSB1 bacterium]
MLQSHYLYFLRHNIRSRLFGKRSALLAGMKITYRCNLRCKACPFWKMENHSISYKDACAMMDNFYDNGVRLLIFEGGEPFLWQDGTKSLNDLVTYARRKFFCTGITSNGVLPIETEADVVWISIDGLRETHNANRGNSFDRVIENVR